MLQISLPTRLRPTVIASLPGPGIEESQRLDPDPFTPRARCARAIRCIFRRRAHQPYPAACSLKPHRLPNAGYSRCLRDAEMATIGLGIAMFSIRRRWVLTKRAIFSAASRSISTNSNPSSAKMAALCSPFGGASPWIHAGGRSRRAANWG